MISDHVCLVCKECRQHFRVRKNLLTSGLSGWYYVRPGKVVQCNLCGAVYKAARLMREAVQ